MPNDDTRPFVTTEVAASLATRLKDDEPGAEPAPNDGAAADDEHADEPAPFRTPPTVLRRP
jgi:hypothetical protein